MSSSQSFAFFFYTQILRVSHLSFIFCGKSINFYTATQGKNVAPFMFGSYLSYPILRRQQNNRGQRTAEKVCRSADQEIVRFLWKLKVYDPVPEISKFNW
jgi:hypothetical protein